MFCIVFLQEKSDCLLKKLSYTIIFIITIEQERETLQQYKQKKQGGSYPFVKDRLLLQILHKVQFIKRSNNLASIVRLDSVEQDFVEIQRFEDVDLQFSSLLVRQLFPSFSKNYSVAIVAVVPRDLAV